MATANESAGSVLVTDPDASVRAVIRDTLEDKGFVVEEAASVVEALGKAAVQQPPFEVYTCNMRAPGGAPDLAAGLAQQGLSGSLLVITGGAIPAETVVFPQGRDRAWGTISKPLHANVLLAAVRYLVLVARSAP